ncbi:alpha/beta fold hydrolase [Ilumatobacter nonamiensis]|uniref:alpha/beta fold hydrolase n=1 Tax=Ilumatobacter nonamiensis TaxID=467093 RepID=UPI00130E8280|nr:alpha/beta fold hydrolase [Ilumatobacter nonamiensis]
MVAAACSASPPVAVERSDRSAGELTADTGPGLPDVGGERSPTPASDDAEPTQDDVVVEPPESSIAWSGCAEFGIPDPDVVGTSGWECATLAVPMDPFAQGEVPDDAAHVDLALTRHPATGDRRGAILVNPGGPGGGGLETVWGLRNELSIDLLRGFDLVSWDPRGVGESSPAIDCDDAVPPGDGDFIARCVDLTGPLSAFLAAPYSVADMEEIRSALGEERLNYLGYSYGTVLGSSYAAEYPDRVGSFVLDGATDPKIGAADGPSDDGFPSLADDGFPAAQLRFEELCNATERCLFSLDAGTVIDDLETRIQFLPTPNFAGEPETLSPGRFTEVLDAALTYAGDWELVATALSDADQGDASALASLAAGPPGSIEPGDDGESEGESDFAEANFMIYCADFAPLLDPQTFCDAMPDNARRVASVSPVDVEREILVIGTEFDPLTPGYHAPEFAAALDDATYIIWEGVGHTAFPGWTPCIDDAVDAQFLGNQLPTGGTSCSFLFGIEDDERLGDELFGQGDIESEALLGGRFLTEFGEAEAACLAGQVNLESDQVISHVILDVTSDAAEEALAAAADSC